ncbi:phage holin family protein [Herbiconiux sp. CPCC 205716]|uniref:Phage holin family protein n=1 Tax=Herbiconiux gentiana TaxID=2970912 RepID=A0ABT2GI60_9MICO|nr:phage holin family protein [Herbiconiux gentiana]MCS5715853.1 phage holin family protein [Herbiconiux gentiana]
MRRFLVSLVVNAIALWLTTLIVAGVKIDPIGDGGTVETIVSYLLVALVFGIVNGIIGSIIRVVAFPLYILTLGIISFFVNALLLWLTAVFTGLFGFGLTLAGFWWTVLGALVLAILSAIIGAILRPLAGRRDRR